VEFINVEKNPEGRGLGCRVSQQSFVKVALKALHHLCFACTWRSQQKPSAF